MCAACAGPGAENFAVLCRSHVVLTSRLVMLRVGRLKDRRHSSHSSTQQAGMLGADEPYADAPEGSRNDQPLRPLKAWPSQNWEPGQDVFESPAFFVLGLVCWIIVFQESVFRVSVQKIMLPWYIFSLKLFSKSAL